MDSLEQKLKQALTRRDPPAGFEQRVMARIMKPRTIKNDRPWLVTWFRPVWRLALAGGLALVLLAGGITYQQIEQRRRAALAHAQLITALRMASMEINRAGRLAMAQSQRSISSQ